MEAVSARSEAMSGWRISVLLSWRFGWNLGGRKNRCRNSRWLFLEKSVCGAKICEWEGNPGAAVRVRFVRRNCGRGVGDWSHQGVFGNLGGGAVGALDSVGGVAGFIWRFGVFLLGLPGMR